MTGHGNTIVSSLINDKVPGRVTLPTTYYSPYVKYYMNLQIFAIYSYNILPERTIGYILVCHEISG